MNFEQINSKILPQDAGAMERARQHWNSLAKPVGSLGRLEELLVTVAGLTGSERITLRPRSVLVACADNGVTCRGVASTPPEITATMSRFIARGRSAVCCMAKAADAKVFAYDLGIFQEITDEANLHSRRIMAGTRDMTKGPAMTREEAAAAIGVGMDLVKERAQAGDRLIATGEMGIGNTTSTSAVTAAFLGLDPAETTGRGVGLSDEAYQNKIRVVQTALDCNRPDPADPLDVLSKVGGLDIAAMAGMFIGGALYRVPVIMDGVISAAAALTAVRLCPACKIAILPSHVSAEPAGQKLVNALGLAPMIHGEMRLGEGTGAALLFSILDQALAAYEGLMTFQDIGM